MVQANTDREEFARAFLVRGDALLHVHRAEQALDRAGKGTQDFVADVLDHAPAVLLRDLAERGQHGRDETPRFDIAARLEQSGAAADIGKQDGQLLAHRRAV